MPISNCFCSTFPFRDFKTEPRVFRDRASIKELPRSDPQSRSPRPTPGCTSARAAAAAPARLIVATHITTYQLGRKDPRSHGAETTSACASARVSVFISTFFTCARQPRGGGVFGRGRGLPRLSTPFSFARGLSVLPPTRAPGSPG